MALAGSMDVHVDEFGYQGLTVREFFYNVYNGASHTFAMHGALRQVIVYPTPSTASGIAANGDSWDLALWHWAESVDYLALGASADAKNLDSGDASLLHPFKEYFNFGVGGTSAAMGIWPIMVHGEFQLDVTINASTAQGKIEVFVTNF